MQGRNERSTILWAPNDCGGRRKVTSTFFNRVHLLTQDLKFERGSAKLVSSPGRHLASLHLLASAECPKACHNCRTFVTLLRFLTEIVIIQKWQLKPYVLKQTSKMRRNWNIDIKSKVRFSFDYTHFVEEASELTSLYKEWRTYVTLFRRLAKTVPTAKSNILPPN